MSFVLIESCAWFLTWLSSSYIITHTSKDTFEEVWSILFLSISYVLFGCLVAYSLIVNGTHANIKHFQYFVSFAFHSKIFSNEYSDTSFA